MSRRAVGVLVAGPALVVTAALGAVVLFLGTVAGGTADGTGAGECSAPVEAAGRTVDLRADQLHNAAVIVATGARLGLPRRGLVVAVATAMQESTLRNLSWGDRDSVGLFQQRPSQGWGTVAELTDPSTAASRFYQALLRVPGWEALPLTVAAQRVQRSAFPLAYAKWESLAERLVPAGTGAPAGSATTGCSVPSAQAVAAGGVVAVMLRIAIAQQGDPYVWGATGPDAFDCSGLIVYAWREAGLRLRVRTAAQMYRVSASVAAGREEPGDLVFSEFDTRVSGPGHVMIVVRPGLAVEAPSAGKSVRLRPYRLTAGQRVGRLTPAAFTAVDPRS